MAGALIAVSASERRGVRAFGLLLTAFSVSIACCGVAVSLLAGLFPAHYDPRLLIAPVALFLAMVGEGWLKLRALIVNQGAVELWRRLSLLIHGGPHG